MENTSLKEKVKNLEVELSQARTQIERMSSAKLDEVLSAQKPSSNKTGLGYAVSFGPSSSTTSGSKIVFVPQSEKGNKGMKSKIVLANFKSFARPHVCHQCGVFGHIHPNYFKLYFQMVTGSLSRFNTFVWRVIKIFELFNSILEEF